MNGTAVDDITPGWEIVLVHTTAAVRNAGFVPEVHRKFEHSLTLPCGIAICHSCATSRRSTIDGSGRPLEAPWATTGARFRVLISQCRECGTEDPESASPLLSSSSFMPSVSLLSSQTNATADVAPADMLLLQLVPKLDNTYGATLLGTFLSLM